MENLYKIICINVLEGINSLPDNSINLIITNLPYFNCRVYGNETIGIEENLLDYIFTLKEGYILDDSISFITRGNKSKFYIW